MKAIGWWLAGALVLPSLASAATHVVTMEGIGFNPATITVKRGDRVTWSNKDLVPHTATAAGKFDSRQIDPGKRWSWTAAKPGRYEYICTYHPVMKGVVVVQ